MSSRQITNTILLIKPSNFDFNSETASSNAFQNRIDQSPEETRDKVLDEFDSLFSTLQSKGLRIHVIEDTPLPLKPDAVFPNNWITFHPEGRVVLYPMYAPNRRLERRQEIVDHFAKSYQVEKVLDLSPYENQNRFLEGTGSIVFDHENRKAYACLSPRTDKDLFILVCEHLHYQPVYFYAYDGGGKAIYHTNVMMCIGRKFAVVCLSSIRDEQERELVSSFLKDSGLQLIDISFDQMSQFAGNMLQLQTGEQKSILVLSKTAFECLSSSQRRELEKFTELVPLSIPTIETIGGGSVRCMIAEVFLEALPC